MASVEDPLPLPVAPVLARKLVRRAPVVVVDHQRGEVPEPTTRTQPAEAEVAVFAGWHHGLVEAAHGEDGVTRTRHVPPVQCVAADLAREVHREIQHPNRRDRPRVAA